MSEISIHLYVHINTALNQTVPGVRRRDTPKLRYMDVVKQDMKIMGLRKIQDRRLWAASVAMGTHVGGQAGR